MKVKVQIDPLAKGNNCYDNCVEKAKRDGGKVVVGWRKSLAASQGALIASLDHHAVWETPQGELIDITPRIVLTEGQLKRIIDEVIDFEIDESAAFQDGRALPSQYVPNVEDTFGLLKKACEWANKVQNHINAGETAKADYADRKAKDLLNQHWKRSKS
jgi:hypothetical protein